MKHEAMLVSFNQYVLMITVAIVFYSVVCGVVIGFTIGKKKEDDRKKDKVG